MDLRVKLVKDKVSDQSQVMIQVDDQNLDLDKV